MHPAFTPGFLSRLAEPPRRVVIVRASRIGDFICATPAFRALRAALPRAEITLIGQPFIAELAIRSPHLHRFEEFPGYPGIAEQFLDARRTGRFLTRMQSECFDLAIQLHGSGVNSNPFTLMLGARATVGMVRPGDGPGRLDAAFPAPARGHEIHRLLEFVEFLGAAAQGDQTEFPLKAEDSAAAERLTAGAALPLIGVMPGARAGSKRWAPERFTKATVELRNRFGGTVVILGGPEEVETGVRMAAAVGHPCRNLAGRRSVCEMGAVISRLSVLLTNDSGPAHIAYALGTPCVTIFGGTEPEQWGPLGGPARTLAAAVDCRPCDYDICPIGTICLKRIEPKQAVKAAMEVMLQSAGQARG